MNSGVRNGCQNKNKRPIKQNLSQIQETSNLSKPQFQSGNSIEPSSEPNKPDYIVMDNYITSINFPKSYQKKIDNYKRQSYSVVNDQSHNRLSKSLKNALKYLTKSNTNKYSNENSERNSGVDLE